MYFALQIASYALWFPLAILTINAILRTGVRRYPIIFTYVVVILLITVANVPAAIAYHRSLRQGERLQLVQTVGELTAFALALVVVFNLIHHATAKFGPRRLTRLILIVGPLLVIAISFLINYDSKAKLGVWVTPWTRDLKFCGAVLDLALWTLLLLTKNRSGRLLLLTGGMGVMFAGNAIGESIRTIGMNQRSNAVFLAGSIVSILADLAIMYIWWRAFRDGGREEKSAARLV